MLSTGQWIFALFFVVGFIIIIASSYRKDRKLHKKHYKGAKWILFGFIVFIAILLIIKESIKN